MSTRPPLRLAKRNGITARELAERAGRSVRTAQRWTSEPREEFLAEAEKKKKRVLELRSKGMSIRAIAEQTGYSVGTVHRYAKVLSGTGV